ncbi:MAG: hypothetical protein COT37_00965 [Parcubacteria group bacterium CG08_land_8_20_14_0_20_43_9]|nr:MAG: hypothetical protein COT37_00965 [Parcubacteria group bacterium CG08_land_8_20_14_0_20_43_9]
MTHRFKKNLFLLICALFIMVAPIVVLYASGYRFDFKNMRMVQTGGLFLKISLSGATIYLDDNPYKKTNFLFDTALISGLLPKNYRVSIRKEGYHSWEKILPVEEEMVTEAKNIILFPKNPLFNLALENVNAFFPAPDEKKAILESLIDKGWSFSSFDFQNQRREEILSEYDLQILTTDKSLVSAEKISGAKPTNIIWSGDSKKILVELDKKGDKQYLITEPSNNKEFLAIEWDKKIENISFNPSNPEEILFISYVSAATSTKAQKTARPSGLLSAIFIIKGNGQETALGFSDASLEQNVLAYAVVEDYLLWLGESGFIYKGSVNGDKISLVEILNVRPIAIKTSANYQIIAKNLSNIFLKEDEGLSRLNPAERILEKFFDSAKEIKFAKDMKKIAVNTGRQIWLYYFEEEKEQPQKTKGEKILIYSSPQEIVNLHWLNNYYLIFRVSESVKVTEIDNRFKPNLTELAIFPSPDIFWLSNKLFVLSNNNLFSSENILK